MHLGYEFDAASWKQRYNTGRVPSKTPYGYHHASAWGYHLTFSKSHEQRKVFDLFRRAVKRFVGFDLWHAWRNRKRMRGVDAIWARPETEYLGILLLRKWGISSPSTPLIAEFIWLFDTWEKLPRWKQELYNWLMKDNGHTVFVGQSEENLKSGRSLFSNVRSELVHFGICLDSFPLMPPTCAYERGTRPLRLLSLGNDVHRDWETLIGAVEGNTDVELRIGANPSSRWHRQLKRFAGKSNRILVSLFRSLEEIRAAYKWADIVVVPLMPNKHISGITVILEAVTAGKPVIATNTGGLKEYFGDDEIYYVPPRDIKALAVAIRECATTVDATLLRVKNAQARLLAAEFTTKARASRHVALTEDLLSSYNS